MKSKTGNERRSDPERIALWKDCCDYATEDLPVEADFPEAYDFLCVWEDLDLRWARIGPHPFKAGDRVILFRYHHEGTIPTSSKAGIGVQAIEVIDVGPSEVKIRDGNLGHFVATRELKGLKYVTLSPDHVLDLRSQGLITSIADLQRRKKLSQVEWDRFVNTLELRQEQAEAEKRLNVMTS